jgi:glycyl-tRNA synthetase
MKLSTFFGQSGSIGKRYARADEIGIPNAITVDYQTLEDDTVTVRNINDASQIRIKVGDIK